MAEALAAAVAGRGDAVAAGGDAVVEVGGQPALLDHHRLLGRRALVVDRVAAPLARQAAVVVGGQQRLGDLLAELADVDAGALLDVVGLEPVAGHLVEEDAAEAAADDHRHRAGRAGPASSRVSALRAACSAISPGSSSKSSKPRWAPSVSAPVSTASPRRATAWAPIRTRVRSSPVNRPSELATVTSRRTSA